MTDSPMGLMRPKRPMRVVVGAGLLAVGMLAVGLLAGVLLMRGVGSFMPGARQTTITQSVIVERLQPVAKLITTEAMVRDVITYEQTWLGSTKRTLVVATGKALVGVDLRVPPRVTIRASDKHITLGFPRARLLGVDITELRTYDERRGLWNAFQPTDRDEIFQLARAQLGAAARDLAVIDHAERGARLLMQSLFASEGWTVDVVFGGTPPIV